MEFDSFDTIRIITSFQLILISIALLFVKSKGRNHKLLSLFLFTQASYLICGIFKGNYNYFTRESTQHIFYIVYSFSYFLGPSLYFYFKYITQEEFKIQLKHLSHFILFFIILIFNPLYLKIPSTDLFLFQEHAYPTLYSKIAILLLHFQILGYLLLSNILLNKYIKKTVPGYLTDTERSRLNWRQFLLIAISLIWIIESLIYFTYVYYYLFLCHLKIVLVVLHFVIANLIVIQGLRRPDIFNGEGSKYKYQKNIINKENKGKYLKKLVHYIESEAPYLDSTFSLSSLAEKTGIPAYHISQILNTELHTTFYDYINSYRVATCKQLIRVNQDSKKSILEFMYDSGFSSKSVFNKAFKKHTGITPTEFKNRFK